MKKKKCTKKRFSLRTVIFLVFIIFMISAGLTMIAHTLYKNVYVVEFPIWFKISESNRIGFSGDPNLHFGKVPNGGASSVKKMNLHNDFDFPVDVFFEVRGNVTPFVTLDNTEDLTINPGNSTTIEVKVITDSESKQGDYEGVVTVIYRRI